MALPMARELIDAGVHFGHRSSRWNPKMKPFIFGKRNLIHIVDIRETIRGLLRAKKFISQVVADGSDVLFVGTKRQARDTIQRESQRCNMHYVVERWLGGTLTNFRTIRSRLKRLEELEELVVSPQFETAFSKKMQSTQQRELTKIKRNLDGIRRMNRLPGVLVVVDVRKETNAVREARMLSIPTVCLIDTDGDPDYASIAIPGNDDSIRAIDLIIRQLADAVEEGLRGRPQKTEDDQEVDTAGAAGQGRRRLRRPTTSARAESQSPGSPAAPAQPAASTASARPAAPTEPAQPAASTEPAQPAVVAIPAQPAASTEPAKPITPAEPTTPVKMAPALAPAASANDGEGLPAPASAEAPAEGAAAEPPAHA